MHFDQKLYIIENTKGERYPFYTGDPYWPEEDLGSFQGKNVSNGMFVAIKVGEYIQPQEPDEEALKWCAAWTEYRRQKKGVSPIIDMLRKRYEE